MRACSNIPLACRCGGCGLGCHVKLRDAHAMQPLFGKTLETCHIASRLSLALKRAVDILVFGCANCIRRHMVWRCHVVVVCRTTLRPVANRSQMSGLFLDEQF